MGLPQGTTITMATSGFTANMHLIGGTEMTRGEVPDYHIGTSGQMTFVPESLYDPGGFEAEFEWNQSFTTFPPISGAAETITISFPLKTGETVKATLAGTGFLTMAKGPDCERNGGLMTGRYRVKWDGKTPATYTKGS